MPPRDQDPLGRPSLIAGRGIVGTLAWVFNPVVAVATVVVAARRGHGWGTALAAVTLATAYTFVPWIRAASDRVAAKHRRQVEGTLTVEEWGVRRVAGDVPAGPARSGEAGAGQLT